MGDSVTIGGKMFSGIQKKHGQLYIIVPLISLSVILVSLVYFNKKRSITPSHTVITAPTPIINEATIMAYEFDALIITETPTPSLTPKPTKTPTPSPKPSFVPIGTLDELIVRYANKESVDPALLKKIAACESGLNAQAVNGPYAGLYQFTQGSWETLRNRMNLDASTQLRFDPEEAVRTAAYKLALNGRAAWPNCSR